jgi:hypothetical protein
MDHDVTPHGDQIPVEMTGDVGVAVEYQEMATPGL